MRLLDYVGTVSFAMSGAATAGMRGMNLLGCVFVGVLAATGGGTLRDLLLGQTPVFWLVEVSFIGLGVAFFFCHTAGVYNRLRCLVGLLAYSCRSCFCFC